MQDNRVHIKGIVDTVIYHSTDSFYTIFTLISDEKQEVTCCGICSDIGVGENVEINGVWVNSRKYGKQIKTDSIIKVLPSTITGIRKYLSSGAIKGIGPKIADKILSIYGEDAFEVIFNHPDWLVEIKGISKEKAIAISKDFQKKNGLINIISSFGGKMSLQNARQIYEEWGDSSVETIRRNPYCLCNEIEGISFLRADEIALEMGIQKDNINRIKSAVIYTLKKNSESTGNTYAHMNNLCKIVSESIDVCYETVYNVLQEMSVNDGIVIKDEKIFMKQYYFAEKYISEKLILLNQRAFFMEIKSADEMIDRCEAQNNVHYAKMQRRAIILSLQNGVSVLTGGPGTGKTTIIKVLIQIFELIGKDVVLCAPTGRAAKRMSEATSHEAKTIHRLLEMNSEYKTSSVPMFSRNEKNPLGEDVIIVDEMSMVDVLLFESLLKSVKCGAKIVLIGDSFQLPSVGVGNVLKDLISSDSFATTCLVDIFRQDENCGIVENSQLIHNGLYPDRKNKYNDYYFIQKNDDGGFTDLLIELCKTRIPRQFGYDLYNGIQVISPVKRGSTGIVRLNSLLQKELNPSSENKNELAVADGIVFREGDKVMQNRNNYCIEWNRYGEHGCGMFNGDVGYIKKIDTSKKETEVIFDNKTVIYDETNINELDLSYAITVHKSQGTEYPVVIIPIYQCSPVLQTRNLIYTAITRASKVLIMVGRYDELIKYIDNNTQIERQTYLETFLRSKNENPGNN